MKNNRFTQLFSLSYVRNMLGSKKAYHDLCERNNLVYFGAVTIHDEDAHIVRGMTLSNVHADAHYCVGTVFGRDVVFLQRSDNILSSDSRKHESYVWNILEIDLSDSLELTHTVLDGGHHERGFYSTLLSSHRTLQHIPEEYFSAQGAKFAAKFRVFAPLYAAQQLGELISPDTAAILAHHFSDFDFEWHADKLYVYYQTRTPSLMKLELMLRAGVWLSGELDPKVSGVTTSSDES